MTPPPCDQAKAKCFEILEAAIAEGISLTLSRAPGCQVQIIATDRVGLTVLIPRPDLNLALQVLIGVIDPLQSDHHDLHQGL